MHFEFLRPILSLSFSPCPSPPLCLLSSSHTRNPTCRAPCVQRATPSTPSTCAAPALRVPVSVLRTLPVHKDIQSNDMGNLSNVLRNSCQQSVCCPVWSQPWLPVHILRQIETNFMNFCAIVRYSFRVVQASTRHKKPLRKEQMKQRFSILNCQKEIFQGRSRARRPKRSNNQSRVSVRHAWMT